MRTIPIFLFLVLIFSINPSYAIVYESMFDDPIGLGGYDSNTILVSEGTSPSNLVRFYTEGPGSSSTNIVNISGYLEDACISVDGYIYFVLTDGKVYQFTGGAGYYDFYDDYTTNFLLLGDMDAGSTDRCITVDANGNVYSNSGSSLYKFSAPSFSGSILHTFSDGIDSISQHPNGLLIGYFTGTNEVVIHNYIYMYNDSGATLIHDNILSGLYDTDHTGWVTGVYSTSNGDIYYSMYNHYYDNDEWYNRDGLFRLNASNVWEKSTLTTFGATSVTYVPSDLFISNDGIIYASFTVDDTIKTYSTFELASGYSYYYKEAGASGDIQLVYDESNVYSQFNTYNNNSDITLVYNIEVDLDESGFEEDVEFTGYYKYQVMLFNPDDILIDTTDVLSSTFDFSGYYLLNSRTAEKTGSISKQSSNWQNGTWMVNLYEYNCDSGLIALLDSDTFTVTNQSTETIIDDITEPVDVTEGVENLLNSNIFIALIIMIACIGAFVALGAVGIILGATVGICFSAVMQVIPTWILFVWVLTLIVIFTSKLINNITGD